MHAAPLFGTAPGTQEQTIGSGAEDEGEPTVAPGEEIETEVEKETMETEEEMRKPRVGLRPVQPTRAEIAEHIRCTSTTDHGVTIVVRARHDWRRI
jgi:hypothetical protein